MSRLELPYWMVEGLRSGKTYLGVEVVTTTTTTSARGYTGAVVLIRLMHRSLKPTGSCTVRSCLQTHWYCTLHTAHCTLHTAHCTLHTAHCTLHTAHCTLHTEFLSRWLTCTSWVPTTTSSVGTSSDSRRLKVEEVTVEHPLARLIV